MARFDVYGAPERVADATPFLLDVQSDLLEDIDTSVVIPLRRADRFSDVQVPSRLMPVLRVLGEDMLLETPKLAAVPRRILKNPITSLAHEQASITAALDFLVQGY